jgi:hypothetical protein
VIFLGEDSKLLLSEECLPPILRILQLNVTLRVIYTQSHKFVYHKVTLTCISTYHLFLPYHRTMQRGLNHISSLMLQASNEIEVTLLI